MADIKDLLGGVTLGIQSGVSLQLRKASFSCLET